MSWQDCTCPHAEYHRGGWCSIGCVCTGDAAACPTAARHRDPVAVRRGLELSARDECRGMTDEQLGLHLVWLRRALTLAEVDETPDWLAAWDGIRLLVAEHEWDWRKRAESRGGPMLARANWRERLEAIKARRRVEDVASLWTDLKRAGRELAGRCPLHADKTPSFYVNVEKGTWLCRGACGVGGDVIRLVELHEDLTFVEALRWLEGPLARVAAIAATAG